jgi:hypothetical protein
MRLRRGAAVRIDMRFVVLLALAGCWSTPRPRGPAVLLRRQHAVGDTFRVCSRGEATMTAPGAAGPMKFAVEYLYDEHVLAVAPHRYEIRDESISASGTTFMPGELPKQLAVPTNREGKPYAVDERNHLLGVPVTAPAATDTDQVTFSFVPYVTDILGVTFPERAVRERETFPLHVKRTIVHDAALPTKLAIDATFTVRAVTAETIELDCKGTHVELVERGDDNAGVALDFTCHAQIARKDGHAARWWFEATGHTVSVPDAKTAIEVRARYDVAVARTGQGVLRGPASQLLCRPSQ